MKCHCGKLATKLLIDYAGFVNLLEPICEEDLETIKEMDGEDNIDYFDLEPNNLEDIIIEANKRNKNLKIKYLELLDGLDNY